MKPAIRISLAAIVALAGLRADAQFLYTTNNGAITIIRDTRNAITGYTGSDYALTIPSTINNLPVTSIASGAFFYCAWMTNVTIPASITSVGSYAFENCGSLNSVTLPNSLTSIAEGEFDYCPSLASITIPESVTSIGDWAFANCASLAIYFTGNAPSIGGLYVFANDNINTVTAYYLPGTTGWATFNANSQLNPAVLWNPQAQNDASFGVQNNQFGFNITGTSNLVIVVEACTNLANPAWQPVQTVTLTGGESYFSDLRWTNYSSRYYRFRSP